VEGHSRGLEPWSGRNTLPPVPCVVIGKYELNEDVRIALSRRRSVPVDDLLTDVMKFWGGVRVGSPSRSSFMKGYEVLLGMPKDFADSVDDRAGRAAEVAS
jgi:hypothetical protein